MAYNAAHVILETTRQLATEGHDISCPYTKLSTSCCASVADSGYALRRAGSMSGRHTVRMPTAGRNEQTWYTKPMLVASASLPRRAAPMPPRPNARPKKNPETVPILPGNSSCAKTKIVENADARINPITTLRMLVQNRLAYGSSSVNGSTPRMEYQITTLRPMRSPTGPPKNVPAATAPRKMKR